MLPSTPFPPSPEQQQGWHYDYLVRLRDDTYALGPWVVDDSYAGALTSSSSGNFNGINDHNFIVDRAYADTLLRGLTEDYYFNATLEKVRPCAFRLKPHAGAVTGMLSMMHRNLCPSASTPLTLTLFSAHLLPCP